MDEDKQFKEIYNLIEELEVDTKVTIIKNNIKTLKTYWEVGKLIVEAQGGKVRAKYGDSIIKKWSIKLTEKFGNKYGITNLKNMRQFYLTFPIVKSVIGQLTWTHYRYILPLKNKNERNYYINQIILNNLSVRELKNEIKNKAFDRLSYADKENIKLIDTNNYNLTIKDMIKDPILLKPNKDITKMNEKMIHKLVIDLLENRFLELGIGFTLAGHEYKIKIGDRTYKIDLLFFNYELNCFVVVEVKTKENKSKDIGQLEMYIEYVNKNIKKINHNKTEGILLVEKENGFIIDYITNENIYVTRYEMVK